MTRCSSHSGRVPPARRWVRNPRFLGSFTANVTIPAGASSGNHTITASDGSASASTRSTCSARPAGQAETVCSRYQHRRLDGRAGTDASGRDFELHGEGFDAGTVSLAVQGGQTLGDAKAGADGLFAQKVSPSVQSGGYTIVASEGSGRRAFRPPSPSRCWHSQIDRGNAAVRNGIQRRSGPHLESAT